MEQQVFAVIMAGGRGERFWPECRISRPKQFLNILGGETLIEQTVLRLQGLIRPDHILIVTNQAYMEPIRNLLPDIPQENIIGEPVMRDTAPCVALASGIVKAKAGTGNAVMILLPADHCITNVHAMSDDFQSCISAVAETDAIGTIGINPAEPSPNYGYIECGAPLPSRERMFHVRRFTEKPDTETARGFLEKGNYKWNSGMFFFSVNTIFRKLHLHAPALAAFAEQVAASWKKECFSAGLQKCFTEQEKISFDYALMEHVQNIFVREAGFAWDDIGNWNALRNHIARDQNDNVIRANAELLDCSDCIVYSGDQEKLIAGIDLKGLVIVQTPDATLIAPAGSTQKIKELMKKMSAKTEMQKFL